MTKKKVLVLSDHALSTSGVGTQTRHLIGGLLHYHPGEWTFRQFGAALKHTDYETVVVNEDFIVKPIDGFGDQDMLRVALATEKPDILLIFTDPRFFIWLWEMEDEIHQVCPIAYWHVWDNYPWPDFNRVLYDSTDLINCHSHMTYEMVKEHFPARTNFIPHSLPEDLFFPVPDDEAKRLKSEIIGKNRSDHFVGIWVNRNAKRKRPNDVLLAWKIFMKNLWDSHGHDKATLIMHTDPHDGEGPNLLATAEMLGVNGSVFFSNQRLEFEKMNSLYNICDFCINISYAEGFGLSTLESMNVGVPIVAAKTGGLTRQVVDHRDGTENGVALDIDFKTLVGSQQVPYIYEDYVSCESIANGIMRLYEKSQDEKIELKKKVRSYAHSEFGYQKTIDAWHHTLTKLLEDWEYKSWECETL
jgi:glycosyltransferase involved in cell wall biosynthesis